MRLFAGAIALAIGFIISVTVHAQQAPIKIGYGKCAQCAPVSLLPANGQNARIEAIEFNTGNDTLTALMSKSIDMVQVSYLHYIASLDRGFDVVAVSGHISGGSQCLAANDLPVAEGDWAALRKLAQERKASGTMLKIAASRGAAQDVQMRGAFSKQGIDVNKDLQFINVPGFADHVQTMRRREVDLVCTTEPFASQIRELQLGKLFVHPYDQATGKLTNIILTRSDVIANRPKDVEEVVRAVFKVNERLAADHETFISTIQKVSGLDRRIAASAMANLEPDSRLHRAAALAIGKMMRDLKYINSDVSSKVESTMDYRFLEAVTNKKKAELGY
uniref:ABC transporter substrate-binding protein n=1 Tax=Variovorax sp. BK018 TaxID=3450241 RepID=UPI0040395E1D